MKIKKNKLRRYTSLPVLLDMLVNVKITLLDPVSWEDSNDSFLLQKYKEKKGLNTLLALCFTTKRETFHHWKIFSGNSSGVCIQFDKKKLLECITTDTGINTGLVTYKLIRELKADLTNLNKFPFIKRKQYEDEAEFRIIYENKNKIFDSKSFLLNLSCIKRITLSPWLPKPLSDNIKKIIHNIPGCSSIEIIKTGVIDSKDWKNIFL